jgi:hypothetical protein
MPKRRKAHDEAVYEEHKSGVYERAERHIDIYSVKIEKLRVFLKFAVKRQRVRVGSEHKKVAEKKRREKRYKNKRGREFFYPFDYRLYIEI